MIIKALLGLLIGAGSAVPIMPQQAGIDNVQRWEPLVQEALTDYGIPDQTQTFLRVMRCESLGNPKAHNTSVYTNPKDQASGLMQHMPRYWKQRAEAIGWPQADIFDPIANIYASAWLLTAHGGGWGHWTCY